MTIGQLKEALKDIPDTMDVFIEKNNEEFHFSGCESAKVQQVTFIGDDEEEERPEEDCFVISDEI